MTAPFDDLSDFVDKPAQPKQPPKRGVKWIEVFVVLGIIALLTALLMPSLVRSSRPAARRSQCVNNLEQIALGLYNYEWAYKSLPPAYTVDASGKPLHSWRTLILPFIDQQSLYDSIDLSKPWNDPANAKAYATDLAVYHCPELSPPGNTTTYLAVVAPGGCFLPDKSRRLVEITDDRKLTLTVIEAPSDRAVPWMAPIDADESLVLGINPESKLNHNGGMNAAVVDGRVLFLKAITPAAQRRALISIGGNDDDIAKDLH